MTQYTRGNTEQDSRGRGRGRGNAAVLNPKITLKPWAVVWLVRVRLVPRSLV